MKILKLLVVVVLMVASVSCRSNREVSNTVSVMSMETVSLGANSDGSIIVRAWGSGQNRAKAIEQAKRNAVHDVIFKGIKKGTNPGAAARPLVSEVNAEERYSEYFEPFFSGKECSKFVKEEGGDAPRMKSEGLARESYGVVLIINRTALRNQLVKDGVLAE